MHDLVEDTSFGLADLEAIGYPKRVIRALNGLTKREGESYEAFVRRAGLYPLSRKVKIADLQDNLDIRRIAHPKKKDWERIKKY